MGVLMSNRKRAEDCYSPSYKYPALNSLILDHVSKKPRFSSPSKQVFGKVYPTSSIFSRFYRYPESKPEFRREVHAPNRAQRIWLPKPDDKGLQNMGNALFSDYKKVKKAALDSIWSRRKDGLALKWDKGKKIIDLEPETLVEKDEDVSRDSSMEVLDDVNEVIMVDSPTSEQRWKDTYDKKLNFQPSSSSVVSDIGDINLKVDTAGRILNNLSLDLDLEIVSDEPLHKKLLDSASKRDDKLNRLVKDILFYEKRRETFKIIQPSKKADESVAKELFVPLTEEEKSEVALALSNPKRRMVLVSHDNIDITGETLQCLQPGAWLNDEVINLYLVLLKEREKRDPKKFLKCHFFNTFFYKKLIGSGGYSYRAVRRWTSKIGYYLLDCDKIFVPIHKEIHWCLAVINQKDKKFQYLDSLGGIDWQVMNVLERYIADEVKEKNGIDIDVSSWEQEYVEDLPTQENGYDCGMFMIKYADFYSRNIGLCFNQGHMPYFRQRTAKEILRLQAE